MVGFLALYYPAKGKNLQEATNRYVHKIKRLARWSLISSAGFGVGLIVFFSSTVAFNATKYGILAGMCVTLLVFMYWSYKNWQAKIAHFTQVQGEFR